jgi:hypothetical protein
MRGVGVLAFGVGVLLSRAPALHVFQKKRSPACPQQGHGWLTTFTKPAWTVRGKVSQTAFNRSGTLVRRPPRLLGRDSVVAAQLSPS